MEREEEANGLHGEEAARGVVGRERLGQEGPERGEVERALLLRRGGRRRLGTNRGGEGEEEEEEEEGRGEEEDMGRMVGRVVGDG